MLIMMGFALLYPSYMLKMNKATAEAWLSRLMDQLITVSGEVGGNKK
jgi:hypothetical protein